MVDRLSHEGSVAANTDVSSFIQRRRARAQARIYQASLDQERVENPVVEKQTHFSYKEQRLTDTALSDTWPQLVEGVRGEANARKRIIGIVDKGVIRWSEEARQHSSLMLGQEDEPQARFEIQNRVLGGPLGKNRIEGIQLIVEGYDVNVFTVGGVARYLQRNLPDLTDGYLHVFTYSKGTTTHYRGSLVDYR